MGRRRLLDGSTVSKACWSTFALRWGGCYDAALATVGAAGPEVIADELERDPTEHRPGARLPAHARRARRRSQAEAGRAITGDGGPAPSPRRRRIAEGFHRPDRNPCWRPYVQLTLRRLSRFWNRTTSTQSLMFVKSM